MIIWCNTIFFLLPWCYSQHCRMHILFLGNYIKNGTHINKSKKNPLKTKTCSIRVKEVIQFATGIISSYHIAVQCLKPISWWLFQSSLPCYVPRDNKSKHLLLYQQTLHFIFIQEMKLLNLIFVPSPYINLNSYIW